MTFLHRKVKKRDTLSIDLWNSSEWNRWTFLPTSVNYWYDGNTEQRLFHHVYNLKAANRESLKLHRIQFLWKLHLMLNRGRTCVYWQFKAMHILLKHRNVVNIQQYWRLWRHLNDWKSFKDSGVDPELGKKSFRKYSSLAWPPVQLLKTDIGGNKKSRCRNERRQIRNVILGKIDFIKLNLFGYLLVLIRENGRSSLHGLRLHLR